MDQTRQFTPRPLQVSLIGDTEHREFAEVIELVRATASILPASEVGRCDLALLVQSRPWTIALRDVVRLRSTAPLAGIVSLLGSWCEGETRTGRPHEGVHRVYWYGFAAWWHRQIALWTAGRCPDWARPVEGNTRSDKQPHVSGLVAIKATCWDTAETLAGVLCDSGYQPYLLRSDESLPRREFVAGIWEGRQLDGNEPPHLASFCGQLRGTPVIAMLDFPRINSCHDARKLGATSVIGKPWQNAELLVVLKRAVGAAIPHDGLSRAA